MAGLDIRKMSVADLEKSLAVLEKRHGKFHQDGPQSQAGAMARAGNAKLIGRIKSRLEEMRAESESDRPR